VGEIAALARITERSTYRILSDLVEAGYLRRTRVGRRNRYEVDEALALGDPVVDVQTVSDLLAIGGPRTPARVRSGTPAAIVTFRRSGSRRESP
jgi:hypothetical protein